MEIRTRRTCFHPSSPRDNRNPSNGVPVIACPSTRIDAFGTSEPPVSPVREAGSSWPVSRYGARDQNVHRSSKIHPTSSGNPVDEAQLGRTGSVPGRSSDARAIADTFGISIRTVAETRSRSTKHEADRSIEVFMSTGIDDGAGSRGGLDGLRFARPHANAGRAFVRRSRVEIGPRSRPTEGLWEELPADLSGPQVGRSPLQTLPSLARTRRNRRPRYVP